MDRSTIEEYELKLKEINETVTRKANQQRQISIEQSKSMRTFSNAVAKNEREKEIKAKIEQTKSNIKDYEAKLMEGKDISVMQRRDALRQRLKILEGRMQQQEARKQELKQALLEKKLEAENKQQKIEQEQNNTSVKIEACMLYTGLYMEPMEGGGSTDRIQMSFRKISKKHPNKTYSFILHITETGVYSVSDFIPHVYDLTEEVEVLNNGRDLYAFIIRIRRRLEKAANCIDYE